MRQGYTGALKVSRRDKKVSLTLLLLFGFLFLQIPLVFGASNTTSQNLNSVYACPSFTSIIPNDYTGYTMWIGDNVSSDPDQREGTCFVIFWDNTPEDYYLLLESTSGNGGYNYLSFENATTIPSAGNSRTTNCEYDTLSCSDTVVTLATADGASANVYWHNGSKLR